MDNLDFIKLLGYYRARLAATPDSNSYLTTLENILRDIARKVRAGELTNEQGEELAKKLVSISVENYQIGGLESLNESIEKGNVNISFDSGDSLADTVAALKAGKK